MKNISIIACMAANRVIGANGKLPWHLPWELAMFKKRTIGSALIMGRKTWESFKTPLPGRRNIVLSTRPLTCEHYSTMSEALVNTTDINVFIIGGSRVFEEGLKYADRIYLTKLSETYDGDVLFPSIPLCFIEEKITECAGGVVIDYLKQKT